MECEGEWVTDSDNSAMRTALTPDDMRNIQMKVHSMSADPALRQRFQGLKDTSTLFDIMRIG